MINIIFIILYIYMQLQNKWMTTAAVPPTKPLSDDKCLNIY